jgi:hypothetical protein
MSCLEMRKPLFTIVAEYFLLPFSSSLSEKLATFCRSSLMRSLQSFELDDNCIIYETLDDDELRFDQVIRLTHLRICFWDLDDCVHLLNQLGSQLHSLTVTIGFIFQNHPRITPEITSVNEIFRFNISIN